MQDALEKFHFRNFASPSVYNLLWISAIVIGQFSHQF